MHAYPIAAVHARLRSPSTGPCVLRWCTTLPCCSWPAVVCYMHTSAKAGILRQRFPAAGIVGQPHVFCTAALCRLQKRPTIARSHLPTPLRVIRLPCCRERAASECRRKGAPSRRTAGAKGGARKASSKAGKGLPVVPEQARCAPAPPRACLVHDAFDIAGMPETAPLEDVWAAQKAAAVSAAMAAARPPRGTDAVLRAGSWLHRRTAKRIAAAARRDRDTFDEAEDHLGGPDSGFKPGATVPVWAEDMLQMFPFSSAARLTAAVEHRVGAAGTLRAAFAPTAPFQPDGPTPFAQRSNPAASGAPARAETRAEWAERVLEERRALVAGADVDAARRECAAAQLPRPIQGALEEEMLAAGHAFDEGQKLIDAAPAAAVMKQRADVKSAMKGADTGGPSGTAAQPGRRVRFCVPGDADAAVDACQAELASRPLPDLSTDASPPEQDTVQGATASGGDVAHGSPVAQPTAAAHTAALGVAVDSPGYGIPSKRRKCSDGRAVATACVPTVDAAATASGPPGAASTDTAGADARAVEPLSPRCLRMPSPDAAAMAPPSPPWLPAAFDTGASGEHAGCWASDAAGTSGVDGGAVIGQEQLEGTPGTEPAGAHAAGSWSRTEGVTEGAGAGKAAAGGADEQRAAEAEAAYMTGLERERARRREENKNRLAQLQADLVGLFGADEAKAAPVKKARKVRPHYGHAFMRATMQLCRSRLRVPKACRLCRSGVRTRAEPHSAPGAPSWCRTTQMPRPTPTTEPASRRASVRSPPPPHSAALRAAPQAAARRRLRPAAAMRQRPRKWRTRRQRAPCDTALATTRRRRHRATPGLRRARLRMCTWSLWARARLLASWYARRSISRMATPADSPLCSNQVARSTSGLATHRPTRPGSGQPLKS